MARPLLRLLLTVAGVVAGLGLFIYGVVAKPSLTGARIVLLIALGWGGGAYADAVARKRGRAARVAWGFVGSVGGMALFVAITALDSFVLRFVGFVVFMAVALLGQQYLRRGFLTAVRQDYASLKAKRSIRSSRDASEMPQDPAGPPSRTAVCDSHVMPAWVFWVGSCWLVLLVVLFLLFVTLPGFRHAFPHSYGRIPVEVPWFGAVGGCLVSFGGIFRYNRAWDPGYNYWHPVRPLIGMFTGGIACVLLLALLNAAGGPKAGNDPAVYDGAAFVFGFAESAFRQLITALTDVFIKPGATSGASQAPPAPQSRSGTAGT